MIWLYAKDSYYYSNNIDNKILEAIEEKINIKNRDDFVEKIRNKTSIFFKKQFEQLLENGNFATSIVISPFLPKNFDMDSDFFGVIELPNLFGLLTSSEKEAGITEYQKLNDSLGLVVEESTFSFEDMAGSEKLLVMTEKLLTKYSMGDIPDAVFLAGVPGTGKTFFAQCLAGETGRFLVSFNLTKLMYHDNPIEAFDIIIDFLVKENKRYILWIDEIEKMFNGSDISEHIKNKLLTFLNDLGLTIKMDAFVVMTANNISTILEKNPELIRAGRVETFAKVFMDFPTPETATSICNLYVDKINAEKNIIFKLSSYIVSIIEGKANKKLWIYEEINPIIEEFSKILERNKLSDRLENENKITLDLELKEEIKRIIKDEDFLSANARDRIKRVSMDMKIPISAEDIIYYIDRNYNIISGKSIVREGFPYVPAEIKEIVSQIAYKHYETKLTIDNHDEALNEIMLDNIPIGEAGGLGIDKMKANEDKFSIIIK